MEAEGGVGVGGEEGCEGGSGSREESGRSGRSGRRGRRRRWKKVMEEARSGRIAGGGEDKNKHTTYLMLQGSVEEPGDHV